MDAYYSQHGEVSRFLAFYQISSSIKMSFVMAILERMKEAISFRGFSDHIDDGGFSTVKSATKLCNCVYGRTSNRNSDQTESSFEGAFTSSWIDYACFSQISSVVLLRNSSGEAFPPIGVQGNDKTLMMGSIVDDFA